MPSRAEYFSMKNRYGGQKRYTPVANRDILLAYPEKKHWVTTTEENGDYSMAAATTIEGVVNFSNVTKHDVFNGQDTGAYSVTITMSEDDAATLAAQGVKIKEYQGAKQRKFKSKFDVKRVDGEGNRYNGEIPYNSKVRLLYELGNPHPVHGVATYLKAVKVLEEAEMTEADTGDF